MPSFFEWFIGEAGAGWVIGILGLLGMLYTWRHRERPPKVVVQEISKTRLLDLDPSEHEKLSVYYKDSTGEDRRVQKLQQGEYAVYNNGTVDVSEPLEFSLMFTPSDLQEYDQKSHQELLDTRWVFVDDLDAKKEEYTALPIRNPETGIHIGDCIAIPYLNSYPVHKHFVRMRLISNDDRELLLARRVGRGWSAQLVSLQDVLEMKRRVSRMLLGVVLAMFLLFIVLLAGPIIGRTMDRMFRADSLLWSYNLTSDSIDAKVKKYNEDYLIATQKAQEDYDRNAQEYRESLEKLSRRGMVGRFVGSFFPMQSPYMANMAAALVVYTLALLIMVRRERLVDAIARNLLHIQSITRFA